jgi:hypothetical protein
LLIIAFDEATITDSSACCGETPGPYDLAHGIQPGFIGPGGGAVGAVLLSPYIKAGTRSATPYNHYSLLHSIESLFGLSALADAAGTTPFGSDVFTQAAAPADLGLKLKPASWSHKHPGTTISYTDSETATTTFVIERTSAGYRKGSKSCRPLKAGHKRPKNSRACTLVRTVGSFTHADVAGANAVPFSGRIHGRVLGSGHYVLAATPTLGTLVGRTSRAHFRVS